MAYEPAGTAYHGSVDLETLTRIEVTLREKIAREFETSGRQFWGNADIASEIRRNGPQEQSKTSWGSYPKDLEKTGPCKQ
jgi:hypothetical protein